VSVATRPRIGFLGVGWIGRARMEALAASDLVEPVAVADADAERAAEAAGNLPALTSLEALLDRAPDGIVIATPSAQHASQAITALDAGVAVFCQKPLARDGAETERVLAAAAAADRLLGVDLSYRHTAAARALHGARHELGRLYALELVFHNAYGPDKPWFLDPELSGGGCLIDLGTHLVDLALWLTGSRDARVRMATLRRRGRPVAASEVEDFALLELELEPEIVVRLACSWFLPAGRDCVIECTLTGTDGAACLRNVAGSFYDFEARRHRGTASELLVGPPDDWGGRPLMAWARRLASDPGFDPAAAEEASRLAAVLDQAYRAGR
jgi:predicted dehydrogenase